MNDTITPAVRVTYDTVADVYIFCAWCDDPITGTPYVGSPVWTNSGIYAWHHVDCTNLTYTTVDVRPRSTTVDHVLFSGRDNTVLVELVPYDGEWLVRGDASGSGRSSLSYIDADTRYLYRVLALRNAAYYAVNPSPADIPALRATMRAHVADELTGWDWSVRAHAADDVDDSAHD